MSTEAELLLAEFTESRGLVIDPEWVATELIGWVLQLERRHQTAGHRQTVVTDETELARLGFVHHRDGTWHVI